MTTVRVEKIRKTYGDFVALEGLTLDMAEGEFVSFLGPSGCGKTTALRIVAGFEFADSGSVLIDGDEIGPVPPNRRNMGMVFQNYSLFPNMTAADNVAFGLRVRKQPAEKVRRRATEMLELVGLSGKEGNFPHQMSGGQQQRVALARALVNMPKALLLDEPLGALDLKLRQVMQLELKRIQREVGITFIFVTHDQEEALTMSDRIAVMTQGRTDQIGTPTEIYHRPATAFVAGFIGTANLLPVTVRGQEGDQVTVDGPGGRYFARAEGRTYQVGSSVTLMVRPERLVPSGAPLHGAAGGSIEATVTSLVFQGPVVRCQVQTAAGVDLVAHLGPEDDPSSLSVGSPVRMTWSIDGAYLVPEALDSGLAGVTQMEDDETGA
jgi:spermidine/putrescine transport system ATP-binding protein